MEEKPVWLDPDKQQAKVRVDRRKHGRWVIGGLHPSETDLKDLLSQLKTTRAGGALKDDNIEIQGDHVDRVTNRLKQIAIVLGANDAGLGSAKDPPAIVRVSNNFPLMHQETNHRTDPAVLVAQLTTPFVFGISFVFLICQAALVVLWIDVPQFTESAKAFLSQPPEFRAEAERLLTNTTIDRNLKNLAVGITLALWPLVIAESIFHLLTRSWKEHRRFRTYSPFLRLPFVASLCSSPEMDHRIWLPGMGWRHPNKRLRRWNDDSAYRCLSSR